MAKPSTNVPPRGKGATNVPPRRKGPQSSRPVVKRPPPRRRGRRRSRTTLYGTAGALILAGAIALVIVLASGGGSGGKSGGSANAKQPAVNWKTPGSGVPVYGALGPEHVPIEVGPQLGPANTGLTGATIAGVSCLGQEQLQYHHHVHLAIFINGQPRSVPIGVGMTPPAGVEQTASGDFAVQPGGANGCFYWLHVHAQDGIVHIESPLAKTFVLGQFFAIWHQALSANQIGQNTGPVTATVNGKPWAGDPTAIPLIAYSDIVLNLGTPVISPPLIDWSGTHL
jgi:hypothetical protein